MTIFYLIIGFLLILAGRNLFWLCVGVVGFLMGVQCAVALGYSSGWVALMAAFCFGVLGVLLAIFFEWVAVVIGVGFLGGGYLLMSILPSAAGQEIYAWLIFIAGGITGVCLMVIVFDWTLIIISTLLGAFLIVNALHGTLELRELVFTGCMVIGILVQYQSLRNMENNNLNRG